MLLLVIWCFQIVRPFVTPILWGFILAIAVAPAYLRVTSALGGRRNLAASLFALLRLALFILPAIKLSGTMIAGLRELAAEFHSGELSIPPPPERVTDLPLIGARIRALRIADSNRVSANVR